MIPCFHAVFSTQMHSDSFQEKKTNTTNIPKNLSKLKQAVSLPQHLQKTNH